MSKRLEKSEVIKKLSELGLTWLGGEYVGNKSKLLVCTIDNFLLITSLDRLTNGKQGYSNSIFNKANPYTCNNIEIWLRENNKIFTLEANQLFTGANDNNLKWFCHSHGTFIMRWNAVKNGQCCPECSKLSSSEKRKLDWETIENYSVLKNYTIKSSPNDYKTNKTKLKMECRNHDTPHEFEICWSDACQGVGCYKCGVIARIGDKNGNWNPLLTQEERENRRSCVGFLEYLEWRKQVLKRDKNTCSSCGSKKELVCHHLNGWHWFKEGRLDPNNGVTLCKSCHKHFHKTYGNKYNTKEQFLLHMKSIRKTTD